MEELMSVMFTLKVVDRPMGHQYRTVEIPSTMGRESFTVVETWDTASIEAAKRMVLGKVHAYFDSLQHEKE